MYGCIVCIYILYHMYVLYIHRTTTLIGRDLWNHGITMYGAIRNMTIMKLVILLLLNISKHPLVPQLLCLMSCLLASSTCSRGTGEEPMEKHPASPDELIEVKFKDHTFPIFCLHPSQNWICLTESLWDQKLIVLAVFLFSPGTLSSWSSSPRFCPQLRSSRQFP